MRIFKYRMRNLTYKVTIVSTSFWYCAFSHFLWRRMKCYYIWVKINKSKRWLTKRKISEAAYEITKEQIYLLIFTSYNIHANFQNTEIVRNKKIKAESVAEPISERLENNKNNKTKLPKIWQLIKISFHGPNLSKNV